MTVYFGTALALSVAGFTSRADDQPGDYQTAAEVEGPVPWVSNISGQMHDTLVKQEDTEWFEATVNTPLGEGDSVWQGKGGHSEISIGRGGYIRLDQESAIQLDRLYDDEIVVVLTRGRMEVESGDQPGVSVDLPGQTVDVEPGTTARIQVSETGESEVLVKRGSAQAEGSSGSIKVDAMQTLRADANGGGIQLSRTSELDSFDGWCDKRRADLVSGPPPPPAVAKGLPAPAAAGMSGYGEWIEDPEYGWVWRPYVAPDWEPYREGRWVYRPVWGWTWVSYEPWGWYPYHYGRWVYVGSHWYWTPVGIRAAWSPGLVFWVEGPGYIAWQPLPFGVTAAVIVGLPPAVVVSRYVVPGHITVVAHADFHRGYFNRHHRPWGRTCRGVCVGAPGPRLAVRRHPGLAPFRSPRDRGFVARNRAPGSRAFFHRNRRPGARSPAMATRASYGSKRRLKMRRTGRPAVRRGARSIGPGPRPGARVRANRSGRSPSPAPRVRPARRTRPSRSQPAVRRPEVRPRSSVRSRSSSGAPRRSYQGSRSVGGARKAPSRARPRGTKSSGSRGRKRKR